MVVVRILQMDMMFLNVIYAEKKIWIYHITILKYIPEYTTCVVFFLWSLRDEI